MNKKDYLAHFVRQESWKKYPDLFSPLHLALFEKNNISDLIKSNPYLILKKDKIFKMNPLMWTIYLKRIPEFNEIFKACPKKAQEIKILSKLALDSGHLYLISKFYHGEFIGEQNSKDKNIPPLKNHTFLLEVNSINLKIQALSAIIDNLSSSAKIKKNLYNGCFFDKLFHPGIIQFYKLVKELIPDKNHQQTILLTYSKKIHYFNLENETLSLLSKLLILCPLRQRIKILSTFFKEDLITLDCYNNYNKKISLAMEAYNKIHKEMDNHFILPPNCKTMTDTIMFIETYIQKYRTKDNYSYQISSPENVLFKYPRYLRKIKNKSNKLTISTPKDYSTLVYMGTLMNNCISTYRERILANQSYILGIHSKNKLIYCVEISKRKIVSMKGFRNQTLDAQNTKEIEELLLKNKIITTTKINQESPNLAKYTLLFFMITIPLSLSIFSIVFLSSFWTLILIPLLAIGGIFIFLLSLIVTEEHDYHNFFH